MLKLLNMCLLIPDIVKYVHFCHFKTTETLNKGRLVNFLFTDQFLDGKVVDFWSCTSAALRTGIAWLASQTKGHLETWQRASKCCITTWQSAWPAFEHEILLGYRDTRWNVSDNSVRALRLCFQSAKVQQYGFGLLRSQYFSDHFCTVNKL